MVSGTSFKGNPFLQYPMPDLDKISKLREKTEETCQILLSELFADIVRYIEFFIQNLGDILENPRRS